MYILQYLKVSCRDSNSVVEPNLYNNRDFVLESYLLFRYILKKSFKAYDS